MSNLQQKNLVIVDRVIEQTKLTDLNSPESSGADNGLSSASDADLLMALVSFNSDAKSEHTGESPKVIQNF